ncbi:Cystathionine beta-synthase [Komagataella phaffii CBS 7435]|uniref:Cystathionine beta-synthase n=2 Tax=Komagataella phaffii TaxID=460519 RepID=C4R2R4_KOMPG|nr:Cystathionine beta-synthase, catalyzes the synthesis of cystathionine from serine and homocysteine [Komagataella phaffii GS115]AOA62420.1 GQ67_01208T0 [Komagataella phaffii]CAH2447656.1 Cystathionine beta-synthase [Komagataella phaffii CBS 7435]AOA67257.1 GQ68_00181T0 [Komagataella phaffii GS115]CAY69788.1 Cystathionine beta-synthase, catalyzes the synthesis of cystathionine from serine and homocysteine [Komagataella phaffii GS115]CCA37841.1 Cystathionine beta-synthase [Komagataella phaffii
MSDNNQPLPPVSNSILEHIGKTPLVKLNRIPKILNLKPQVYAKVELFNSGGSIKDRIALRMVEQAEKEGRIKPGYTLIEPTSGNTGIGLALVGAVKGYRTIITLPEKMSNEKVAVLKALGAEIIRTPTEAAWDSPESHIGVARRLEKEIPNAVILDQYGNVNNPDAHFYTTGAEIWDQTNGKVTHVVAGAGTGGTITGIAKFLKSKNPNIQIIGADPHGSILALPESLNTSNEQYKVEGIGYDFIPEVLDREIVDTWYKTDDKDSFKLARQLISEEGILVGGSSGSALSAAVKIINDAKLDESAVVVVVCPDSIRSYLTKFADDDWMKLNGFTEDEPAPLKRKSSFSKDTLSSYTIKDLALKPVVSVTIDDSIESTINILQTKGFDQLPVLKNDKLAGIVTLSQLLRLLSNKKIHLTSKVESAYFDFSKLENFEKSYNINKESTNKRREYQKITTSTTLAKLNKFFETSSAAIVENDKGQPIHIVSKVDLLSFLASKGEFN